MDLSCATNRLVQQQPLIQSETATSTAEDSCSMNSRSSSNSEAESHAPVSVREMIKRYNSAANANTSPSTMAGRRQSHTLLSTKSSYFGINKFGSQTSVKNYVSQIQETKERSKPSPMSCNIGCNRKSGDYSCPNWVRRHSIKSLGNDYEYGKGCEQEPNNRSIRSMNMEHECSKKLPPNFRPVYPEEKHLVHSNDLIDETNGQPIESSYQSKTTITKTSSGVRITIDIFFDQDQNMSSTEVVGSRVETDIPESRILSEFQQQAISSSSPNTQMLPN